MKKCKFENKIIDYVYDTSYSISNENENHIKNCKNCKLLYEFHKTIKFLNANMIKSRPSLNFRLKIFNSIIKENNCNSFIDTAYFIFHKYFITAVCAIISFFIIGGLINIYLFSNNINRYFSVINYYSDLSDYQQKIISSEITKELMFEIVLSSN